jgi:hypothetical protein
MTFKAYALIAFFGLYILCSNLPHPSPWWQMGAEYRRLLDQGLDPVTATFQAWAAPRRAS